MSLSVFMSESRLALLVVLNLFFSHVMCSVLMVQHCFVVTVDCACVTVCMSVGVNIYHHADVLLQ